jgi:hypothetical protein
MKYGERCFLISAALAIATIGFAKHELWSFPDSTLEERSEDLSPVSRAFTSTSPGNTASVTFEMIVWHPRAPPLSELELW